MPEIGESQSSKEPKIINSEIVKTTAFAHSDITRVRYTLRDGADTLVTVIKPSSEATLGLQIHPTFLEKQISLDNSRLISQGRTADTWGEAVGQKPEEFITDATEETIALDPTNAGWQTDAFWIENGTPTLIPNDRGRITGNFDVIGSKNGKWGIQKVQFTEGELNMESAKAIGDMETGLSMPMIVREGNVVPLDDILGDPRLLADLRNCFDFGNGKQLPAEFWEGIRGLLPETGAIGRRLSRSDAIVTSVKSDGPDDLSKAEKLREIMATAGLGGNANEKFEINTEKVDKVTGKGRIRLAIRKGLPLNRIPLFGIGHDRNGELIIVAIDGRQEDSKGSTLEEAAEIMKANGIVNGGLGSAGGDVAVATNTGDFLNSLSTKVDGQPATRPVPSVLTIK